MRGICIILSPLLFCVSLLGCSTVLTTEKYDYKNALEVLSGKKPFERKIGVAPVRFRNSKLNIAESDPEFYEVLEAGGAALIKFNYDDKADLRNKMLVPLFGALFQEGKAVSDNIDIFDQRGGARGADGKNGTKLAGFGGAASEQEILKGLMHECWQNGLDLLAVVTVTRHDIQYKGRNGLVFLNAFMWAYAFFPAWFIADEEYTYTFRAEIQFFPATREEPGRPVFSSTVEYTRDLTLSQWDHGLNIARGIINPWWPSLGDRQVQMICDYVKCDYEKMFAEKLAADFAERYTQKEQDPGFQEELKKRLAFVVGVDRLEVWGEHSKQDILADATYVRGKLGNFKPVVALTGREATREQILGKLQREILARAGADDKIFVYISGLGAARKTGDGFKSYIVPYDFKPPASGDSSSSPWSGAISVDELVEALSSTEIKAKRMVIIADTAFNGDPPRTVAHADSSLPADSAPGLILSGAFNARNGALFVVTACDDAAGKRQCASRLDLESEGGLGLFTYVLRKGLRPGQKKGFVAADLNEDRHVTVLELYSYVRKGVEQISQLEGVYQTPALYYNGYRFGEHPKVREALGLKAEDKSRPVTSLTNSEMGKLLNPKLGLDMIVFSYEFDEKAEKIDNKVKLR